MWKQIEAGLLDALKTSFSAMAVTYNENLLGGPGGWPAHLAFKSQ
jgi:hypothetical protein